jgi:hypothetical protein
VLNIFNRSLRGAPLPWKARGISRLRERGTSRCPVLLVSWRSCSGTDPGVPILRWRRIFRNARRFLPESPASKCSCPGDPADSRSVSSQSARPEVVVEPVE